MRILSKWWTIGLVAALPLACGSEAESNEAGASGDERPPMPVEVAPAFRDTVVDAIRATGEIEAIQSIELRPEVEGRLQSILVREGQPVAKGTPLFRIDDAELRAQVARLEAELDLARQALDRTRELLARDASSQADLEQAEATHRSMRAQLELQQVRLARTIVRAPFAGIVGERRVSIGDYVSSATAVTGETFTGEVDFVDPSVRGTGRMITVKARVPNPGGRLRPGMFIETELTAEVRPGAVVVPEDAILPLQNATYVWVVTNEGNATRREVTLGVRTPGFVEIRSGVEAGERVVVGGLERLSEGAPVAPTEIDRGRPAEASG